MTAGYLAGVTTTLGIAASVLVLPQRQAVLASKQAAEVDILRRALQAGVGLGWNAYEFRSRPFASFPYGSVGAGARAPQPSSASGGWRMAGSPISSSAAPMTSSSPGAPWPG